jgi:hypothetical protein
MTLKCSQTVQTLLISTPIGASLDDEQPVEYSCESLASELALLEAFPRAEVACELQMSERAWRNIVKGRVANPRVGTAHRIRALAARLRSVGRG